jgi:hypothetical protein
VNESTTTRHTLLLTPVGSAIAARFLIEHHAGVGRFHASTFATWLHRMERDGAITIAAEESNDGQAHTLALPEYCFVQQGVQ